MSRIPLDEFCYDVGFQDKSAVVLFVEGITDQRLMLELVPIKERTNAIVLPISEIDIPQGIENGERGRMIWLASYLESIPEVTGRVFFFVDADNDRFTNVTRKANVIITDYGDVESYILNDCSLSHILFLFGEDRGKISTLRDTIISLCKPVKLIRVHSNAGDYKLPVSVTVEGRLSRYTNGRRWLARINVQKLVNAVCANRRPQYTDRSGLINEMNTLSTQLAISYEHWVHGKDLAEALSIIFGINLAEAKRIILSAIHACIDVIRQMANMSRIDGILRA